MNNILPFIPAPQSPASQSPVSSFENLPGQSPIMVGPSPAIAQLWAQIRRVSPHFRTALLTGEPGTGAEAVARVLHSLSPASEGEFLKLTPPLAEERLRANINEAFLYLPAVERLNPGTQASLLNLLHRRGQRTIRVVGFARTNLRPLISTGEFSSQLASTLSAVTIAIPALRDRPEDIALLATHQLHRHAAARGQRPTQLSAAFLDHARQFAWPGNLDQLSSVFRWLVEHRPEHTFEPADLEAAIAATAPAPRAEAPKTRLIKLDDVIQEHIRAVLVACNGNKLRSAEVLGISRSTLYRMLDATSPLALAG